MRINEDIITYAGQKMKICCDRKCNKAWGVNSRPTVQLSNDDDDFYFLADDELGEAPANPGTYEGGQGKPTSPDKFPNKWCIRECERCAGSDPGKWRKRLFPVDFSQRLYNQPWKHHVESSAPVRPRR